MAMYLSNHVCLGLDRQSFRAYWDCLLSQTRETGEEPSARNEEKNAELLLDELTEILVEW